MALSALSDVRSLGNLPAAGQLPDDTVTPHLNSASRELKSLIGEYESTRDTEKQESCIEAECCICIAYLQPILQKLYIQGLAEDVDPPSGEWQKTADSWMDRAKSRVNDYIDDNTNRNKIGWHAI